jgi:hypothetical protein
MASLQATTPIEPTTFFDSLPSAATLWQQHNGQLILLEANQAFRLLFRKRAGTIGASMLLDEVVTKPVADVIMPRIGEAVQHNKEISIALQLPAIRATSVRVMPMRNSRLALFWKGDMEESPLSTPVFASPKSPALVTTTVTTAASSTISCISPGSVTTASVTTASVTTSSAAQQATTTPTANPASAMNSRLASNTSDHPLANSPLKRVQISAKTQSPNTKVKAAKVQFDMIENGARLDNPRRDLGEVLSNLVAEQNSEAVEHALAHGADPDGRGGPFTPLYAAIRLGRVAMCEVRHDNSNIVAS